jgi:Spy/CpxP family protein refolding chaperone
MRRKIVILGVVCTALVIVASLSKTQAQPPDERGGGPPGMGMRDPEQMRRMMTERMKEQLSVTDEEWKVMQPKLQKVMDLTRQSSGFGRMGMFFGRPRRFGGEQNSTEASERTAVEKATEELQELLDSESTTPDQIKAKLTSLREAKEKAKQELAQAQQELKKILTLKQEARLVLMGLLN